MDPISFISAFAMAAPSGISNVASDEHVVVFDVPARLSADGKEWVALGHGWIYEPEASTISKRVIEKALKAKYGLRVDAASRSNFDARTGLLLVDNERGKRITFGIDDARFPMNVSKPNGHFKGQLRFPRRNGPTDLPLSVILREADTRRFEGRVHLIEPQGVTVISDIDDTVKVSHVTDRARLMEYTFLRDFEAVPGMAALYQDWRRQGAAFHFVSSSPWHLYAPLKRFLHVAGFPAATLHLKLVRLKDRSLFNLFKPGTETKPQQIQSLLEMWPERRFVLVGDSGEQDPEVYAALLAKHPKQILKAYIRNVTNASPSDARFKTLFAELPKEKWALFTDPSALTLPATKH